MNGLARLVAIVRAPAAKPVAPLDLEALEREIYQELYGIRSGNVSRDPCDSGADGAGEGGQPRAEAAKAAR